MASPRKRTEFPGIFERETRNGVVFDVSVAQGTKRIWRTAPNITQAKKLRTKLSAERDKGLNISSSKLTVETYLEGWLTDYASTLEETTYKTYCINLRVHIIPALGKKLLKDLTPADVQKAYAAITEKRSSKTCLNVHRVFSEALSHAVRLEILNRNVCNSVIAPRPSRSTFTPPSLEDLDKLLKHTDQTQYGALVRVCLWTGLRQGELIRLRWADVDLVKNMLYVQRRAKHGSTRAIVLSQNAVDILIDHRIKQQELFKTLGKAPSHDLVFTNSIGNPVDAGGLKRVWGRPKTGIKALTGIKFHGLRHSHASLLIASGTHPKVVQERLGHKNIGTTMDVYGHLMAGLQEEAALKIDTALGGILIPKKPEGTEG